MTKHEIKIFSQDMTCALLEPLNHCSQTEEKTVFKTVLGSIVHFSNLYGWIVTVESNIVPGSYFEIQALSEILNKNLFETFFSNVANVASQLFDRLPYAIQESMLDECNDTEENSLPADTLE